MTWYWDFQVSLHTFKKNIIGVLRQRSPGRSCPGPGFHKKLRRELSNALSEVPAPVKSTTSYQSTKALISQFKRTVAQLPSRLSAPKSATGNTGNTVILLRGGLIATRRACLARNRAVTMCQVQTLQAPHTMFFSDQFQSPHMTQSWGKLRFFDIPESTFLRPKRASRGKQREDDSESMILCVCKQLLSSIYMSTIKPVILQALAAPGWWHPPHPVSKELKVWSWKSRNIEAHLHIFPNVMSPCRLAQLSAAIAESSPPQTWFCT